MTGEKRGSFPREGSNWFRTQPDPVGWKADLALLEKTHKLLRDTIAATPFSHIKRLDMILGVASHDLYHAGQIQLLKRLQRGGVVKS